jgi:hypothetical protein
MPTSGLSRHASPARLFGNGVRDTSNANKQQPLLINAPSSTTVDIDGTTQPTSSYGSTTTTTNGNTNY